VTGVLALKLAEDAPGTPGAQAVNELLMDLTLSRNYTPPGEDRLVVNQLV
jgi:hypothetical protein